MRDWAGDPKTGFDTLVADMVQADMAKVADERKRGNRHA